MEAIRFCSIKAQSDKFAFYRIPDYVEVCKRCEWFYPKSEADAEIARLEDEVKHLREQLARLSARYGVSGGR
jgi:hypothetical protein